MNGGTELKVGQGQVSPDYDADKEELGVVDIQLSEPQHKTYIDNTQPS